MPYTLADVHPLAFAGPECWEHGPYYGTECPECRPVDEEGDE